MNPVAKELWIKGLTSGEYIQGTGKFRTLCDGGKYSYCAMGVLVDVYCQHTGKRWEEAVSRGCYSLDLFLWAGILEFNEPFIKAGERTGFISVLNDSFKIPFPLLAEAIKGQL